jgi:hypothetical protein
MEHEPHYTQRQLLRLDVAKVLLSGIWACPGLWDGESDTPENRAKFILVEANALLAEWERTNQ